jgi:hypothetical protein
VAELTQPADAAAAAGQTQPADAAAAAAAGQRRDSRALEEAEVAGRAPSEAPMAWRWIWGRWGFTSPRECKPPDELDSDGCGEGALVLKKVQGRSCLGPRAPPAAAEEAAAAAALKPGVPSSRTRKEST